jgi:acetate kinase
VISSCFYGKNSMKILILNAGSSTLKSRLYVLNDHLPEHPPEPVWEGNADWSKQAGQVELSIQRSGQTERFSQPATTREAVTRQLLASLWSGSQAVVAGPAEIALVGHRVVHGGPRFRQSVLVTAEVETAIDEYAAFAPAHNPANLEGIRVCADVLPQTRQVAVFDTAFHSQLPEAAAVYPGPYAWYEQGLRRYGFHGINHQYCAQRAASLLGRELAELRLITCHLGNGCSLAAIRQGHSVDTTMGFTPLEGLMMGTRSGSLDPGLLLNLLQNGEYSPDQLNHVLNKESGLLGVSGISGDMRTIIDAQAAGNLRAKLALDVFVHRLRQGIGAMLAVLGGLDALIFTGGIGEHADLVRTEACATFGYIGLYIDEAKNTHVQGDQNIAHAGSTIPVLVIRAEEDWMIAREAWKVCNKEK